MDRSKKSSLIDWNVVWRKFHEWYHSCESRRFQQLKIEELVDAQLEKSK